MNQTEQSTNSNASGKEKTFIAIGQYTLVRQNLSSEAEEQEPDHTLLSYPCAEGASVDSGYIAVDADKWLLPWPR